LRAVKPAAIGGHVVDRIIEGGRSLAGPLIVDRRSSIGALVAV
jgi:hypothetical protein